MSPTRALLLLALIPAASAYSASAEIAYDTYGSGVHDPDILVGEVSGNDVQYAFPFEVPPGGDDPQLETVTLRLRKAIDPAVEFVLRLRADAAGEPGTVVESWTLSQALPNETDVELTSVVHPVLGRGDTYWLHMSATPGTGQGTWAASGTLTEDFLFSTVGGLDPPWQTPTDPFPVGLVTVEVPEPGQALLGLAGAAVLLGAGRRRARSS